MKEDPKEPGSAMGCDLLATEGYGEIIGGGQREDNIDLLLKRLHEHQLNEEHFKWYLDLRKYGAFQSSGFGLGVERTVAWICGIPHIRETIPFPRMYGRMYP
jgi:asparaginyl-tRNA synthetase